MKPCRTNRKLIACLALGHVEWERAVALREHLKTCDGCRSYLDDLAAISATAKATALETDIQAAASFHPRLIARVKAEGRISTRETVRAFVRAAWLNWRIAAPVAAGLAAALAMWILSSPRPHGHAPASSGVAITGATRFNSNLEPTIANYQAIANQSLDELDQLLNDQGRRNLPVVPIYTASTIAMASKLD